MLWQSLSLFWPMAPNNVQEVIISSSRELSECSPSDSQWCPHGVPLSHPTIRPSDHPVHHPFPAVHSIGSSKAPHNVWVSLSFSLSLRVGRVSVLWVLLSSLVLSLYRTSGILLCHAPVPSAHPELSLTPIRPLFRHGKCQLQSGNCRLSGLICWPAFSLLRQVICWLICHLLTLDPFRDSNL